MDNHDNRSRLGWFGENLKSLWGVGHAWKNAEPYSANCTYVLVQVWQVIPGMSHDPTCKSYLQAYFASRGVPDDNAFPLILNMLNALVQTHLREILYTSHRSWQTTLAI